MADDQIDMFGGEADPRPAADDAGASVPPVPGARGAPAGLDLGMIAEGLARTPVGLREQAPSATIVVTEPESDVPREKAKRPKKRSWSGHRVGGHLWSLWIDPETVPLCDHQHDEVGAELAGSLVKMCLFLPFFRRRCLTAPWREYPAGRECLTYREGVGDAFDLFVLNRNAEDDGDMDLDRWIEMFGMKGGV